MSRAGLVDDAGSAGGATHMFIITKRSGLAPRFSRNYFRHLYIYISLTQGS